MSEIKDSGNRTEFGTGAVRDIEEELERYHNAGQMLGMECDEKQWTRLLELLKTEKENKWQESMKNSLY